MVGCREVRGQLQVCTACGSWTRECTVTYENIDNYERVVYPVLTDFATKAQPAS